MRAAAFAWSSRACARRMFGLPASPSSISASSCGSPKRFHQSSSGHAPSPWPIEVSAFNAEGSVTVLRGSMPL